MKTTIDLPPDLVREMKILAVYEGRKLKDVAADLLRRGLNTDSSVFSPKKATIKLPLFQSPKASLASRMSTAELLALEQESFHQEDLQRVGLSL